MTTIASLIGKGGLDSSFKYHLINAKNNGITKEELVEIITHLAFYCGWPNVWAAFNMAKEVYTEDEEAWYQEEGKEPQSLKTGDVVTIPANVKHWHGAKNDSWFSHLAVEVPGEDTSNEWCEKVTDEEYDKLQNISKGGEAMTIAEVSKKYELTADTLRYYEKIGLLSNIPRKKNGIRDYDEKSCRKIEFIKCMRNAGVEIEILIKYMTLFEKGKSTVEARKQLLEEQREKLLKKQKNINETIDKLNYKIELYEEIYSGKRKDFTEEL